MKKFIAILLVPVFLMMTSGVAITSLYCKGKISEVGLNVSPCCKDVNKGGCCNTETKIIKVDDAFVSGTAFEMNKFIDLFTSAFEIIQLPETTGTLSFKTYRDKAPPLIKSELYILFRSLII